MNVWGTLTTIVLIFVIFSFLSLVYNYLLRESRVNGWGTLTKYGEKFNIGPSHQW